ncbi:MAG: hypothetical protein QOI75_6901 [Pseudonocardiales bacterium]|nr:hypothetical protein [Pseudonocardiales bacterium]
MKLATFRGHDGRTRVGVVLGEQVADLSAAEHGPATVLELLGDTQRDERVAALLPAAPRHPLGSVTLQAPIPAPPKYLAIGINSRDHRREVNLRWLLREPKLVRIAAGYALAHPRPRYPFFFAKATSSVTGPFEEIWLPAGTSRVDWEGELAVVVGAHLREASVRDAEHAIAGYLIANDVSVRDWQTDNPTSAAMAKGFPSHGPLGPWLATPDEIDLATAEVRTFLNGELRQRGRIAELIRSPADILSQLSRFCALEPGDVVACGTFAGTGWPAGRFLRPGDTIRVEIDGIGHIENPVTTAPPASPARPTSRTSLAKWM